jgi:predicted O-methyltransferase YrrM
MGYWGTALGRIAAEARSDAARRDFRFTKELLSFGLTYEQRPKAPMADLFTLFPDAEDLPVDMGVVRYRRSNVNPFELFTLKAVVMLLRPARIFELGTFDGATTLALAQSAPEAEVLTLDLPDSAVAHDASDAGEMENLHRGGVGSRFSGTAESARITQLRGDSTTFDFSPYTGSVDLVFVDACHDYPYVRADSQTALRLVSPGGVVMWHDYQRGWPGVVRAVDEVTAGRDVHHVAGTDFAVVRNGRRG